MSSKFNSSTALNKTPGVCHASNPEQLQPTTILPPILQGWFWVQQPNPSYPPTMEVTTTVRQTANPFLWQSEVTDQNGLTWTPAFGTNDEGQTHSTGWVIFDGPTFVLFIDNPTSTSQRKYPLDTGNQLASSTINADNGRYRITL